MDLIAIVLSNDVEALRAELARGADPNTADVEDGSALIHATIDNRVVAARLLLEAGADPDFCDNLGNTALHYAAQGYYSEMAQLLLAAGASVDPEDVYGNTPLWKAVFNSQVRGTVIELLLNHGANSRHRDKNGKSPLDLAKTIAIYDVRQFFTDRRT